MDGVVVSTHGGRQVDRSVAALEALPDVVAAIDLTLGPTGHTAVAQLSPEVLCRVG